MNQHDHNDMRSCVLPLIILALLLLVGCASTRLPLYFQSEEEFHLWCHENTYIRVYPDDTQPPDCFLPELENESREKLVEIYSGGDGE